MCQSVQRGLGETEHEPGGADPVVSAQTVQLHLAEASSICEVEVGLALHRLPVHVQIGAPEEATQSRLYPPGWYKTQNLIENGP